VTSQAVRQPPQTGHSQRRPSYGGLPLGSSSRPTDAVRHPASPMCCGTGAAIVETNDRLCRWGIPHRQAARGENPEGQAGCHQRRLGARGQVKFLQDGAP